MGIAIAIRMLVMPPVQRAPLDDRPLPSHRAEDCQYPPQEWSAFIRAVRKHPVKANGDSQNGQRVEADHQDQIHQAQAVSPAEVDAQKQAEEGHTNTKGHGRFFVEWFGGWKWRGAGRINSNRGKAVHSTLQSKSDGGRAMLCEQTASEPPTSLISASRIFSPTVKNPAEKGSTTRAQATS